VDAICRVDLDAGENPLNAKDYVFAAGADAGETQLFNYVVLGYAYLSRDSRGLPLLTLRPALRRVLDDAVTYLKPLHAKGIKVLVEVRSGDNGDNDAGGADTGDALGLATLDMAGINEFIPQLKNLVDRCGVDGFEFNDVGGGSSAYPPATRALTQSNGVLPLYPESLFHEDGDPAKPELDADAINRILWIEGGSNLSNLIQRVNEELKETYSWTETGGAEDVAVSQGVERKILVRDANHGGHLVAQIRMEYMPDAYTGASPAVVDNLAYIVHAAPFDDGVPAPALYDEAARVDVGAAYQDKYAPFAIDLGLDARKAAGDAANPESGTARWWARRFLLRDPSGSDTDAANQNVYGALYFTRLPAAADASATAATAAYLTYFTRVLFGRNTRVAGG